jgi:hypothetical protein
VLQQLPGGISDGINSDPVAVSAGPTQQLVGRWEQMTVLLQVLLPFLASCGEYLLLQLLAAPAVAGIAIAGFALVQVRLQMGARMCDTAHMFPGFDPSELVA